MSNPVAIHAGQTSGEVRPYEDAAGFWGGQRPKSWSVSCRANQTGRRGARKPPKSSGGDSNSGSYGESRLNPYCGTAGRVLIAPLIAFGVGVCILAVIAYAWRFHAARCRVLAELARTNAELKQRLTERAIDHDDVAARDEVLAELVRN